MNNSKNLLIAILTGLLGLSLFTQPAQGLGQSKEAKIIEYAQCLENFDVGINTTAKQKIGYLDSYIVLCAKYRP
jgi:hypothetical protein